mmetsp:Transcript_32075/g.98874  ORF Transcript_32075/g.98874 Transcript_32075/m.98874 type:complete len:263 (+) Transcript_32075:1242-2030(+)
MRVAARRLDREDAVLHPQDRNVEGAAAQVEDEDARRLLALLGRRRHVVEAVRQSGRGRLVDDAHHLQAGDTPGVLRRLALLVVEVRGHRDDGARGRLLEVRVRDVDHLLQHHGRHLLRREALRLAVPPDLHDGPLALGVLQDGKRQSLRLVLDDVVVERAANHALDVEERAARVGRGLLLRRRAHQTARVRERDVRRRRALALGVREHLDLLGLVIVDRYAAKRCAEVDAEDGALVVEACHVGDAKRDFFHEMCCVSLLPTC